MSLDQFWNAGMRPWLGILAIVIGVLCVDQSLKFQAEKQHMTWSDPQVTLGYRATRNSTNLNGIEVTTTYARNSGAAWGRGRDMDPTFKNAIFVTALVFAMGLCAILLKLHQTTTMQIGCALVAGGALGNQTDRAILGYVIDWLHVSWHIRNWRVSFPVLNFADLAICVGVPLIAWEVIRLNYKGTSSV
jgi:lipoprotein signal peptidase